MHTILVAWSYITGIWLLYLTFRLVRFFGALECLKEIEPSLALREWPRVSLVIPACNEGATIGPAVQSLRELDYPNLEIVLINDRSTDDTGEVMRNLALQDPRIRVVDIKTLPEGWLGKVHALARGEEAATGEWLLFTDADVHHRERSLKKAMTVCLQRTLDFLCVTPSVLTKTLGLRIFVAQFFQNAAISLDLNKINLPEAEDCMGAGAYNLVRRDLFRRSKGFEWLRMEVIDDIGLAKTMKEAGAKMAVMSGLKEVEIEWYPNLWAFVKGLEKNTFSVFHFSLAALLAFMVLTWAVVLGFTLVPWWSGDLPSGIFVFACAVLYLTFTGLYLPQAMETSPWIAAWFPLSSFLSPLIVLRAALICLRQGGIYWRSTFYPLEELKKNQRLKPLRLMMGKL